MTFVGDLRGKTYPFDGWARSCDPHRAVVCLVLIDCRVQSLGSTLEVTGYN